MRIPVRPFGNDRHQVAILGQGTWQIEQGRQVEVIKALRRGLDLGMTHIDTAEMYGYGAAEEVVGTAIRGRREEVFLVSKVLPGNASRQGTVAACERSLRHLGVDFLDCYLLHWRGQHPLAETIAGFDALQQAGKIRSWGLSNFDVGDLEEALMLAGPGRIACNQVLYHLQERAIEHAVLPWCERNGVALVAYSPFGHGSFPQADSQAGRVLAELAAAYQATPRQIALAFLTRHHSVFTIPKAASVAHVEENAAAATIRLDASALARLEQAFPPGRKPASLPML